MNIREILAKNIELRRKALGMSKADFAEAMKVAESTSWAWENPGSPAPQLMKLEDIAEALNTKPHLLIKEIK